MTENTIYDSLYSRAKDADNSNKTMLVDYNDDSAELITPLPSHQTHEVYQQKYDNTKSSHQLNAKRKIIGVLFSVSRYANGEIFPIYEGTNTIGRNPGNDVRLPEATIDEMHATLYAGPNDYPCTGYILSLRNHSTTYGAMVGEDDVLFDSHIVHDNDILLLGHHYQFIVKLFCQEKNGLYPVEDFTPTEIKEEIKSTTAEKFPPEAIPSIEFYTPSTKKPDNTRTVLY